MKSLIAIFLLSVGMALGQYAPPSGGPAAAGTLTGSTLASGVTASSLTSVGALQGLSLANGYFFQSNDGGGTSQSIQLDDSSGNAIYRATIGGFLFCASNPSVTDLSIKTSGNVGIGTTTQAAKLAINGGVHVGGDSDPGDNNLLVDGVFISTIATGTAPFTVASTTLVANLHAATADAAPISNVRTTGSTSFTAANGVDIFTGSTAAQTVTLPAPTSTGVIFFKNQSSVSVTVASASGSQIYTTSAQASVTVLAGDSLILFADGTYWNQ